MHWEAATRYPQIADKMGRQRFDKIKRFLHFNDNSKAKKPGEQGFDKLYKIRPVLGHIRSKFLEVTPEEHHSIDEQMIPFKGRSSLRQYLPKKPTKWGMLKIKGFPCIGTLNKTRLKGCLLLTDGEMKKRERGTSDYRTDIHSGVIVVKWLDNNTVCLASTYAGITPQDTCRRWNVKDKSRVEVSRPAIVYEYNRHMGGVDLVDMLVEMCRNHLRTRKWYMRIFWWLIDTTVCNSWLLFRSDVKALTLRRDEPMILRTFRSEVAAGLYASARVMPQLRRGGPSADVEASPSPIRSLNRIRTAMSAQADGLDHWPKKTDKQSRCKECKSGYTTFECEKCELPLCLTAKSNCFKAFHTK
ncbi:piggyBac transposable element-derived protein 3-like [Artemia franciscana]